MSRHVFLQSAFQFGFFRRNLLFFPWNLAWTSLYTVETTNLLVCRLHSTTARSKVIIIFKLTVLPRLCQFFPKSSGLNNAFLYTFKSNITQYAKEKKKKRKNKVGTFTTIFAVGYPSNRQVSYSLTALERALVLLESEANARENCRWVGKKKENLKH